MKQETTRMLLASCANVRKRYEEENSSTGYRFSLLRTVVDVDNEKVQSDLLISLLDPRGSHGQKGLFLDLFAKRLGLDDFDADNAKLTREKNIGQKVTNMDLTKREGNSGGIIDIFIESGDKQIIIENKRNAVDQERQLLRYYNAYENAKIVYLTPDGRDPDKNSYVPLSLDDFTCWSYKKDIVEWLRDCREKVSDMAYLAESLRSYELFINPDNTLMEKIVDSVMENRDYIVAAFDIADNVEKVRIRIRQRLFNKLYDVLEKDSSMSGLVFCLPSEVEKNMKDKNDRAERIRLACENRFRPYGLRINLATYKDVDVYAGLFLNENIYFCMYVDEKNQNLINKDFYEDRIRGYREMFEPKKEITDDVQRQTQNIILKRAIVGGSRVKIGTSDRFTNPSVLAFAAGNDKLVSEICEQFRNFIKEGKQLLDSK